MIRKRASNFFISLDSKIFYINGKKVMLRLCKTMHTLLGFPDPDPDDRRRPPSSPSSSPPRHPSPRRFRTIPAPDPSSGLRILAGVEAAGAPRPSSPNVLESSAVPKRAPPPPPPPAPAVADRGSGPGAPVGMYKIDYRRGELCTESLGAESCVGAMSQEEEGLMAGRGSSWGWKRGASATRGRWREERKRLPPPLSWLGGEPRSRFLRAEREQGRIRLTEVQIERQPEVFRASRCDGRLRLALNVDSDDEEDVEEEGMVEEEKQQEEALDREEEEEEIAGGGSEREVRMVPATRCQDTVVGGDGKAMWLGHRRFVTTA